MPYAPFSRRQFLQTLSLGLGGSVLLAACARTGHAAASRPLLVYVGTYGPAAQDTIFLCRLEAATGALTQVAAMKGGVNPSYLTVDARHRFLYAVHEVDTWEGAASGGVSAFAIDPRNGSLTLLNRQASGGTNPCYISLTPARNAALVANYSDGTVSSLPIRSTDGQLLPLTALDRHEGRGPHKNQTSAHAHCLLPDPAGRFYFAVDLGTDTVYGYRPEAGGTWQRQTAPAYQTRPSAGPRHLTFHPRQPWAYLINELDSTMTALAYDAGTGTFRELHTLSCLPAGFTEWNACADVHVSPDGRFLYGSNRGHNSLVVYAIDQRSGRLTLVEHVLLPGKTPRNFALDPSGRVLLVAQQQSNSIISYLINAQTGRLTPTPHTVALPSPVCLRVLPDFTQG